MQAFWCLLDWCLLDGKERLQVRQVQWTGQYYPNNVVFCMFDVYTLALAVSNSLADASFGITRPDLGEDIRLGIFFKELSPATNSFVDCLHNLALDILLSRSMISFSVEI